MKKGLAVRAAAAAAAAVAAGSALASEAAVEGQGDLQGIKPLLIIVGGVTVMGIVIWLGLKLMNKSSK